MGSEEQILLTHDRKQAIKRLVEMSWVENPTPYYAVSCIHELTASIFAHFHAYVYRKIDMADTT
jgi:hypothetical protein